MLRFLDRDRFETALRGGATPVVEAFLGAAEGLERAVLRSELEALEAEYRTGEGPAPPRPPAAKPVAVALIESSKDLEILEELGQGAMGVVYRARQVPLDRVVALKMLRGGVHAGSDQLSRFHTEALAVARLSHPNIVQIYEVGTDLDRPYFLMEFVGGGSLARKLKGGALPIRQAAEWTEVLARAVQAAHDHGIVHRDLKPANILLTLDGQPKITDFGLAKMARESHADQTRSGVIIGTPTYMAPEQAHGFNKEVGPAADIHALGATLYEMLTGRPPFRAETALRTMVAVLEKEPEPPHRLRRKLPRDMETICLKCLEKEPERRYPSAAALADDLHAFRGGEPIRAQPSSRRERAARWVRRRPAEAALGAVGLAALVGLTIGVVWFDALTVAAVAVLGLLIGGSWYHARLQKALRAIAHQQLAAERYAERLHLLGEMTRKLLGVTDTDTLLYLISETAARLANAELATIFLVDEARGEIWSRVTLDVGVGDIRVPLGVGIAGAVARSGLAINIPDAYADPRFNPEIDRRTGYRTHRLLALPMIARDGRVVGVLQLLNKRSGPFDTDDEEILAALATSAAVAVECAWAHASDADTLKGSQAETRHS